MEQHKSNIVKMRTFLKTCLDAPFLKDVFDVKIHESRAKSFYKLKDIKIYWTT